MGRLHLREIGDQSWCPRAIRYAITDYLQFVTQLADPYGSIVPRLREALERTKAERVVDLGSGAGGPWLRLHAQLNEIGEERSGPGPVPVTYLIGYPEGRLVEGGRTES